MLESIKPAKRLFYLEKMSAAENGRSRFNVDFPGVVKNGEEIGAVITEEGEIDPTLRRRIKTSIERLAEVGERSLEKRTEIVESLLTKKAMALSFDHLGYKVVILYDNDQNLSPARVTRGKDVIHHLAELVTRLQVEGKKNGKTTGWLITLPDELSGKGKMVYSFAASVLEREIDKVGYTTLGMGLHVPLFRRKEGGGRKELPSFERTFIGKQWKIVPEGVKTYDSKASGNWISVSLEADTTALIILGEVPECDFYGHPDFMGTPIKPNEIPALSFHIHL